MARILLVEDEAPVAEAIRALLVHAGYEVVWITNGRFALEMHEEQPFDLVVCDLIMPEVEGIETIRTLRRASAPVPIIAMSGSANIDTDFLLRVATEFGTAATFKKPLRSQPFLSKVAELVDAA